MSNRVRHRCEVLVVGAGPAGIAAAVCAAERGKKVTIVDDNASPGGQIWRGGPAPSTEPEYLRWHNRLSRVQVLCGARIFEQSRPGVVLAERGEDLLELSYEALVLATGARERFLPFPGWTLPNVVGAGGLQALVKTGLSIRGKRVVIAGTGPLLLAVAAYLHKQGAIIPLICDQASWASLVGFGLALLRQPAKLTQAVRLKLNLPGIKFSPSSWPIQAEGNNAVERITISRNGKREQIACDYLACGFHLVPNTELAQLLGCQLQNGFVQVDEFQRTSRDGIFCAGEPTSIGGVELALIEGQIAGLAAAGRSVDCASLSRDRARSRRFARALDRAFRLRSELKDLVTSGTIVCRCEDVPYSRLAQKTSWRSAKLHTRCGMGPCQGRICGPATQFFFKWSVDSVRPPLFPVRLEHLAAAPFQETENEIEMIGGLQ